MLHENSYYFAKCKIAQKYSNSFGINFLWVSKILVFEKVGLTHLILCPRSVGGNLSGGE